MYQVGDTYEKLLFITPEQERIFTELTGDYNPIHLDEDAAKQAGFPSIVVHGMLAACMVGAVIGMDFPGNGTVIIDRHFQFVRPIFVSNEYKLHLKVLEINEEDHTGNLKFTIKDTNNKICLTGSTLVRNTKKFGR